MFGDEIAIRAQTLIHDAANPAEVMRDVDGLRHGRPQPRGARRDRPDDPGDGPRVGGASTSPPAARWPTCSWSGSTSAPASARRCACTFERWNGNGYPAHVPGEAIPLPMRVVHLSHDMEAIGRLFSPDQALEAARDRRDRTYDPALADLFVEHGRAWFERLREAEPWDAVLALEPEPHRVLSGEQLDEALDRRGRLHRPQVPLHGRAQPPLRGARRRRRPGARARRGGRDRPPPRRARARLRDHRGAELDLGQARSAHAHGVRPGRAAPDADRADAAPLAGARRRSTRSRRRTTRSATARATTSACAPTPTISARASWRRRRSTSG